jgi:nucleoside-diphosphate-sugar epimerase
MKSQHKVLIGGAAGTIGIRLVRALVAGGYDVIALTRSEVKAATLRQIGAAALVADALDPRALTLAVRAAGPTHVIHQLTALPKAGPRRDADLEATNRLRVEGTRHLLDAAIAAGAHRFLVGSFAPLAPRTGVPPAGQAAAAIEAMERQVLDATQRGRISGVILRYGMFYGPDVPSTIAMVELIRRRRLPIVSSDTGLLPFIHLDDAVSATLLALEAAPGGAVYDIVDDRAVSFSEIVERVAALTGSPSPLRVPVWLPRLVAPYFARMTSLSLPLSNRPAREALGWRPQYPTAHEGLEGLRREAA